MKKLIDKNSISPEWPVRGTIIAGLLADRIGRPYAWAAFGLVVGFLWVYTARTIYTTEIIGIAGESE